MLRFFTALFILAAALAIGAWLLPGRHSAQTQRQERVRAAVGAPAKPVVSAAMGLKNSMAQWAPDAGPPEILEHPLTEALCRDGMVLVDGLRCPGAEQRCVENSSTGCARYETHCKNERVAFRFCIDRYEYPNQRGVRPALMISFEEAERACSIEHKRLCTDDEWTFACEGVDANPFPYGGQRRETACNTGPAEKQPPVEAFWNPKSVSGLVARYDRRAPSGEHPECVSTFGVYDLTGNAAEWVTGTADPHYASALKGGDFMNAPLPCRSTHALRSRFYRSFPVGFRCCANPIVSPSGPRPGRGAQNGSGP